MGTEHPRIRGENWDDERRHDPYAGTSPHTRGKPDEQEDIIQAIRNIPAYAGKTTVLWHISKAPPGTSPHTRGKLVVLTFASNDYRNIPAYAGKTQY